MFSWVEDLRSCILSPYLTTPNQEHQDGNTVQHDGPAGDEPVEDIGCSQSLHDEGKQVAQPQLVVLHGVGSDSVLAAKAHQQELCPQRHEALVRASGAAEGHVAKGAGRGGVGQLVQEPEDDLQRS